MREKILAVLEKNSRISPRELAELWASAKKMWPARSSRWKKTVLSAAITP